MVRVSFVLSRIPVIKFRKGGGSGGGVASPTPAAAPSSAPGASAAPAAAAAPPQVQQVASMSSAAISDIDLPLRYQRQPLSQEEIDHINGGGVV